MSRPLDRLRHHVTGAIERGEKTAIAGQPAKPERLTYGARSVCRHCGADVEFLGMRNWRDRGGNRSCGPYVDTKANAIARPTTKHAPTL